MDSEEEKKLCNHHIIVTRRRSAKVLHALGPMIIVAFNTTICESVNESFTLDNSVRLSRMNKPPISVRVFYPFLLRLASTLPSGEGLAPRVRMPGEIDPRFPISPFVVAMFDCPARWTTVCCLTVFLMLQPMLSFTL